MCQTWTSMTEKNYYFIERKDKRNASACNSFHTAAMQKETRLTRIQPTQLTGSFKGWAQDFELCMTSNQLAIHSALAQNVSLLSPSKIHISSWVLLKNCGVIFPLRLREDRTILSIIKCMTIIWLYIELEFDTEYDSKFLFTCFGFLQINNKDRGRPGLETFRG